MELDKTLWQLIQANRDYFLFCVSECGPSDIETLQSCIDEETLYKQDFTDTLIVAKETNMCLHLYDVVDGFDGDLGDDFKFSPGAKDILLQLIEEHGRIEVMRKIINGIRRAEEDIAEECKDICRIPDITQEDAEKMIKEKFDFGFGPSVSFGECREGCGRIFMGMLRSPSGSTISF